MPNIGVDKDGTHSLLYMDQSFHRSADVENAAERRVDRRRHMAGLLGVLGSPRLKSPSPRWWAFAPTSCVETRLCLQEPAQPRHLVDTVEIANRDDQLAGAIGSQHRRHQVQRLRLDLLRIHWIERRAAHHTGVMVECAPI